MARKKKNASVWGEEPQRVPRADIPTGRKGKWKGRLLRTGVWLAILQTPFSLMAMMYTAGSIGNDAEEEAGTSASALVATPGQAEARLAVEAWINEQKGSGGQFDSAKIISWAHSKSAPALTSGKVEAYVHAFSVQTATLGIVEVESTVYRYKESGAVVAAPLAPSVAMSGIQNSTGDEPTVWKGYDSTSEVAGVESSTLNWAQAFASGNGENLRVAMRDPATTHTYPTLDGVKSVSVNVVDVAQKHVDQNDSEKVAAEKRDTALARIEVVVTWGEIDNSSLAKDAPAASDAGGAETPETSALPEASDVTTDDSGKVEGTVMTFDVLLSDVNSGAPVVTAWGAVGEGSTLTPYQNAYVADENATSEND